MSVSVDPSLEDGFREMARKKGVSASAYISELMRQAIGIGPDADPVVVAKNTDATVIPVVLNVPASLKADPDGLTSWLTVRVADLVNSITGASHGNS